MSASSRGKESKSRLLGHGNRAQGAMEYFITYGWMVVVLIIVVAALYRLGVTNPGAYTTNRCATSGDFTCMNATMYSSGNFAFSFGQSTSSPVYITAIGCNTVASTGNMMTYNTFLPIGSNLTTYVPCYSGNALFSAKVGTVFSGYLIVNYTSISTGQAHTVVTPITQTVKTGLSIPPISTTVYTSTMPTTTSSSTTSISSISSSTVTSTSSTSTTSASTTSIAYLYCVGTNGATPYTQVYYAPVSSTGVGTWSSSTSYPVVMNQAGCSINGNYIYCVGGGSSPYTQTYYAPISTTGVGTWTYTTPVVESDYPYGVYIAGCTVYNNYIYCVGTGAASPQTQVYYAPLSTTGIGTWTSSTSYPLVFYYNGFSIYSGYIYCVGTPNTSPFSQVYYAPVSTTGVGTWSSSTSYPIGIYIAGCSVYNSYIYCVGTGALGPNTQVYYAPISSTGVGTWSSSTSYPTTMYHAGCSINNGYIYCIGSYATPYTQVYYAPISSTGVGTWSSSSSYPVPMYDAWCEIWGNGGTIGSGGFE